MRFSDIRISWQFGIFFILVFLIPTIMIVTFFFIEYRNIQVENLSELAYTATLQQTQIENVIREKMQGVKELQADIYLRSLLQEQQLRPTDLTRQQLMDYLRSRRSLYQDYESLFVLDTNGRVIVSSQSRMTKTDWSEHLLFREGQRAIGVHEFEQGTGTLLGYFSAPIFLGDGMSGVIIAEVNLHDLIKIQHSFASLNQTGELELVRDLKNGMIEIITPTRFTSTTDGKLFSIPYNADSLETRALDVTGETYTHIRDYRGHEVFAATRYLPENNWALIVKKDRQEVLVSVTNLSTVLVISHSASLLILLIVAMYLRRFITRPIFELTQMAEQIQRGDRRVEFKSTARNEIGLLARALQTMSRKLIEANTSLEKRVRQKTSQLRKALETLRKEESKDEALLSSIGEGMIATDIKGKIVLMNRAAEQLLSVRKENGLGKIVTEIIPLFLKHEPLMTELYPALLSIRSKKKLLSHEYELSRDGEFISTLITSTPVLDRKKVLGAIMIFRDISKEKEIDRMKSEFVSIASHQLRGPLAALKWYGQLVVRDQKRLSNEQKNYLERMNLSTRRLISMVDDFLVLSKVETRNGTVGVQTVQTEKLLQSLLAFEKPVIEQKHLRITVSYRTAVRTIKTDEDVFREALGNVIENAMKYSPDGGTVRISVQEDGSFLLIEISDQGPGIPKEDQAHIFSQFFRGQEIVKQGIEGTGLGLYTSKRLMSRIHGEIGFRVRPGGGTTFWLKVPRAHLKNNL